MQAAAGEPGVLVDPVPFNEGDEAHVRALGGVAAVVLTSGTLVQDAARGAGAFGCPVLVPEAALPAVAASGRSGARGYSPEADLPAGLLAVSVPDGPSPGETARYTPSGGGTLIVGDAVLGEPLGRLSLPPRSDLGKLASAARGLRALLALPKSRCAPAQAGPSPFRGATYGLNGPSVVNQAAGSGPC